MGFELGDIGHRIPACGACLGPAAVIREFGHLTGPLDQMLQFIVGPRRRFQVGQAHRQGIEVGPGRAHAQKHRLHQHRP